MRERPVRNKTACQPPVIVQNAGQVNVGGQQVNITQAKNRSEALDTTPVIDISPDDTSDTNENEARLLQPSSVATFSITEQVKKDRNFTTPNIRKKRKVIKNKAE